MADMSVWRGCGCRDADGRQFGLKCPKREDNKHGVWRYRISAGIDPVTGKRRQIFGSGFASKKLATKARDLKRTEVSAGTHRDDGKQTVAAFLTKWLEDKIGDGGLRPSSALMYRRYVEMDLIPGLGRTRLSDLTEGQVEAFLRGLRAKDKKTGEPKRGAVTVRRIHAVLRSALGDAKQKRLVAFNAAVDVALPAVKISKVRPWEPEDVAKFLDSVGSHRLGVLYELAVFSGLRRGEVTGLRWADIDVSKRVLTVRTQRVQVGGSVVEGKPKTKAGEDRRVDLGERSIGALMAHRLSQELEREEWGEAYEDDGLVFAKENGAALLPQYVTRTFDALVARAGVRRVKFHDLRHTAASLMLSSGVDIAIVSKRLGHSSLGVSADVYSHLIGNAGRSAADAAESLVPPRVHTVHTQGV